MITLAPALAQQLNFSVGMDYGNFNMKDLKNLQTAVQQQFPVHAKETSSFPAYFGYHAKVYGSIWRFQFGVFGAYNSTGSRLSYQDYSGSIEYNQHAKLIQFGTGFDYFFSSNRDKPWQPFCSFQIAYGRTTLHIDEHVVVGDANPDNRADADLTFHSRHFTLQPAFGLRRAITKHLYAQAQAGYFIDAPGDLKYDEDKSLHLVDDHSNPLHANWSGFRLGLSAGVSF